MKTVTKVILAITSVLIWIAGMFVFVPYDMKAVSLQDDFPNIFFDTDGNYMLSVIMDQKFENSDEIIFDLNEQNYICLSKNETYDFLMKASTESLNGYIINNPVAAAFAYMDVTRFTFFEHDNSSYILFNLAEDEKAPFRILSNSYAIFKTDSFSEELTQHFYSSTELISQPSNFTAIEAMIQTGIVTGIYIAVFVIISLVFSTIQYKKEKEKLQFTNDDTTSSSDIKKYIRKRFGEEIFSGEKLSEVPCITIDANKTKATLFIWNLSEKYREKEIFIGSFFEESNYIAKDSTLATYIKEYLDENSYSSIICPENKDVIEWIVDGNNAEETSVSFYMQNLNILIYPVRQKLYVFCKNSNDTFAKLIDIANDLDLSVSASN